MSPLLPFLIGTLSIASIILAAPTPSAHHHGWYYPRYQPGQPYIGQSHVNVNVPGLVNFNGQKVYTSTVGLRQQERWNPSNGLFTRVLPTPQCVPCVQNGARNPLLFPSVQPQTNGNDLFNWLFNMTNNPFGFLQPTITRCCPITTTPKTTTTTTTTQSTPTKRAATVDTSNRLLLTKPMLPCLQCSSSISLNINGQQVLPAQSSVNVETLLALLGLTCCPTTTTTVAPTTAKPTTAVPTVATTTVVPTTGAGRLFFNNLPCIQCSQDETSGRNPDLALFNLLFSNRPLGFICCPRTTTTVPTTITTTTVTPTISTTTTVSTTVTAPPTTISTTTTTPTVSTTVTAPPTSMSTTTTTVPTEPPTVPTEPPTVPTEPPTVPTVPTEPPTIPTEPPTVPTEPPTVPTEPPTVPTEPPTVPTEPPTVPTVPTEPPTVPTEPPTVPTVPTEPPTIPTEPPTVPTEPPTVIPTLPPIFKQRTFSSDSNNGDSLPTDAIPLTGLRLLMNLFPPSSISFYRR